MYWIIWFFDVLFFWVLYMSWMLIPCQMNNWQTFFSHSIGCLFTLQILTFDVYVWLVFFVSLFVFGRTSVWTQCFILARQVLYPLSHTSSPMQKLFSNSGSYFLDYSGPESYCLYLYLEVFSSSYFKFSHFTLRSLIHFELIFV
jgi:hypothetical protein